MRTTTTLWLFLFMFAGLVGADEPVNEKASRFLRAEKREFSGLDYEHEGQWRGPFFFLQMADTQYGMFTGNMGFEREAELAAQAVAHVNRLKPRFVIVCGDLTNASPMHDRYEPQVQQFKQDFSQISAEIQVVCVCGNHDLGNRPNSLSIASYRRNFGDDYFGFWVGGVRSLVLNSTVIKDSTDVPDALEQQDQWFHQQLTDARTAKAAHIFVFQHHPWFLNTPDEPDQYYNLPRNRRRAALEAMQAAGVRAIFAGHYHRNAYGKAGSMEMITTGPVGRPLGKDPSGFRIVKVYRDHIEHAYYGLDSVPREVTLTGETNKHAND